MKLRCHSLQTHVWGFATLHVVLLVVFQLTLSVMFYDQVVYHKGNIPIGFYLLVLVPFLGPYTIYGLYYLAYYRKNKCMLTMLIIYQINLVGLLLVATGFIVYLRLGLALKMDDHIFSTTMTVFDNKENATSALNFLSLVVSVMFALEVYWLVMVVKFYNQIARLNFGETLRAQKADNPEPVSYTHLTLPTKA